MLQQDKIHPRLAFESSGLFVDPESAYAMSKEYYDESVKSQEVKDDESEVNEDVA
jgi:hypothetical protein